VRRVALRWIAVIAAGMAVLAAVLWVATTVDARPPEVAGYRLTQPLTGEGDRALITTSIEVTFSEVVDHASAEAALDVEPRVEGATSWGGTTLIFTPAEPLPLETRFEVTVDAGVVDRAGNRSTDPAPAFSFETAGRPEVVETEPAPDADEVPLDASVRLTFSTLMDTPSVEAALRLTPDIDHELRWSGELLEIVPAEPLRPDTRYRVRIAADAADVAGVALDEPFEVSFRTIAVGLEPSLVIPADGTDGISVRTPMAVLFEEPIDPDSISDETLAISPEVDGSLELIAAAEGDGDPDELRLLRFVPSAPLPPNTTFEVELAAGVADVAGGQLGEPLAWSFTTGAPLATLSNQIVFLSARSGITNLWTMNADGTGQRQLSAELMPVTDYAVAPDGRSFVVGDGRRLLLGRPDATEPRLLTDDGVIEFDPAYSPDGSLIAFGRASADGGEGLGLWQVQVGGGDDRQIELPDELLRSPRPSPSGVPPANLLRAPRYAPDGTAVAFVDEGGRIGIVELPAARLTTTALNALGPPVWLPDSSGIMVAGIPDPVDRAAATGRDEGRVPPLDPVDAGVAADALDALRVGFLPRSGLELEGTALGEGAARLAVDAEGRIAAIRLGTAPAGAGRLEIAEAPDIAPRPVASGTGLLATAVAFAPEAGQLAVALVDAAGRETGIWQLALDPNGTERLAEDGSRPLWLP
jgi:hypothetical protein